MKKGSSIMLRLLNAPHEGRARDGSLSAAAGLAAVGGVDGRWVARSQSLAAVVDSPGNGVCPRAADGHHVVASRRDQRRLRRLLLLPAAPGTQVQSAGRALADAAAHAAGNGKTFSVIRRPLRYKILPTPGAATSPSARR